MHHTITIAARDLRAGDLYLESGRSFHILDVDTDADYVEASVHGIGGHSSRCFRLLQPVTVKR